MNLWLRLVGYLLTFWTRPSLKPPGDASIMRFRAWPHDLDTSLHMNNGRYLTIMDLGRLDLMARSGLLKAVVKHRWTPVANTVAVRFRREVHLFNRFRLETRILGWDETHVIIEHQVVLESGLYAGQVAAHALFKGALYDRTERRFIAIGALMDELGISEESPPLSAEVEAFLVADAAMKRSTQAIGASSS